MIRIKIHSRTYTPIFDSNKNPLSHNKYNAAILITSVRTIFPQYVLSIGIYPNRTEPFRHVSQPPRVVTPLEKIHDVLANQNLYLANLHPPIPSAQMFHRFPRVHYPLPAVPTTGDPPEPIADCTCSLLKVSNLDASSQTFPPGYFKGGPRQRYCTVTSGPH